MALQKITGSDSSGMTAFVVVDLDGATAADGVVRCAKKVLMDGARTMARSRTYSWALLGRQVSGASAGISVAPESSQSGITEFVEQVRPRVEAGELSLDAAKGVERSQLSPLDEVDGRNELTFSDGVSARFTDELLALGIVTAASTSIGDLSGRTVAVEGAGNAGPALLRLLADAGASVVAVGTAAGTLAPPEGASALDLDSTIAAWAEHGDDLPTALGSELPAAAALGVAAEVLICGSKLGLIDHDTAASLPHQLIVPVGPAPVTAKGLAVASSRGITVLADFLTLAGPLHAFRPEGSIDAQECSARATAFIAETTARAAEHAEGPYLGACYLAEEFLGTWQERLPFGRPLA